MAATILVADDSPTIQKVISITLSGTDYRAETCLNDEELFRKIKSNKYDLVLLDFALSTNKSGEDLAQEIQSAAPGTPIMALLGGFESVDKSSWSELGIKDEAVKPFDSASFIQKCQRILQESEASDELPDAIEISEEEPEVPDVLEPMDEVPDSPGESAEEWNIDAPSIAPEPPKVEQKSAEQEQENPLEQEVSGWGMEPPATLSDLRISVPPIIGSEESDEGLLPPLIPSVDEAPAMKENKDLSKEIQDEFDSGDFWSADVLQEEAQEEVPEGTQVLKVPSTPPQDSQKDDPGEPVVSAEGEAADTEEIVRQVTGALTPIIESLVKEHCSEKVERIAWEVIPDLAENLIRKEIKDVVDQVQESPN